MVAAAARIDGAPPQPRVKRRLSRVSWSILVQPISFMSRSISIRISSSARSTPAGPRPRAGRGSSGPAHRLGAERQGLEHVSAALHPAIHDHVDPVADGIDDLGELVEGAARAVELAPAVVRQHDAGAADRHRALGVLHRHHALEAELAAPVAHHLGHVVPGHARIEHLGEVAADREGAAIHGDVVLELRQPEALVGDVVDAPGRLHRELRHAAEGEPERNREAGARLSRSRLPPVMLSTVSIITSMPACLARHHLAVQAAAVSMWK